MVGSAATAAACHTTNASAEGAFTSFIAKAACAAVTCRVRIRNVCPCASPRINAGP